MRNFFVLAVGLASGFATPCFAEEAVNMEAFRNIIADADSLRWVSDALEEEAARRAAFTDSVEVNLERLANTLRDGGVDSAAIEKIVRPLHETLGKSNETRYLVDFPGVPDLAGHESPAKVKYYVDAVLVAMGYKVSPRLDTVMWESPAGHRVPLSNEHNYTVVLRVKYLGQDPGQFTVFTDEGKKVSLRR